MKQMLLTALTALCLHVNAQITVTNSYFPSANDTIRNGSVREPDAAFNSLITAPGGPQNWDLSNAQADLFTTTVYQDASEGSQSANFPGADLVIIGEDGETYLDITPTQMRALGYAGGDPAGFGLNVLAKFNPIVVERTAPLNFFDITTGSTNLTLAFPTVDLPDSLFEGLPSAIDSIRIRLTTQRVEACDGYGTVKLPDNSIYNVLRLKRTEYTTTGLDVRLGFLGWVDISTLLGGGGGGGGGIGEFLGTDTTVTHRFYTNDLPQEVAVLTLNNAQNGLDRITYKVDMVSSVDDTETPGKANISAYPNPAVDWVRFDCTNLPPDEYTIKIYNILGKPVWMQKYQLTGSKSIRIGLNEFKKGTYLYSLINKKGDVIGTKRLVVVKP
jgi:hypothetical protein